MSAPALFVLDTNICIFVINDRPQRVRQRMQDQVAAGARLGVSTVTLHELRYGVGNSARPVENLSRLTAFVQLIEVFSFDSAAAERAAEVRRALRTAGTPIGPYDTLIAGHALSLGAVVVTNNLGEFQRVQGLGVEDWTG